jgi:hypothetical protein
MTEQQYEEAKSILHEIDHGAYNYQPLFNFWNINKLGEWETGSFCHGCCERLRKKVLDKINEYESRDI